MVQKLGAGQPRDGVGSCKAQNSKRRPSAWIIAEAISQLGHAANPLDLVKKVERLQQGLCLQDEFSILLTRIAAARANVGSLILRGHPGQEAQPEPATF